jgi:hypothetical protein
LPSKDEHINKADGIVVLATSLPLKTQAEIDWSLVMFFYAAVHYVEAYLSTKGQHLRSHTTRDSYMGKDSTLKKIYAEYQDLKFYGYNARYEVSRFTRKDVTNEAAVSFQDIKSYLEKHL